MSGTTDVDRNDLLNAHLGGEPKIVYHLYWRDDNFLFDHANTIMIDVAIQRVEDAMKKLRKEYGMEPLCRCNQSKV